jgi:hypothetical protein
MTKTKDDLECSVGGNQSAGRKPTQSDGVAHSITEVTGATSVLSSAPLQAHYCTLV